MNELITQFSHALDLCGGTSTVSNERGLGDAVVRVLDGHEGVVLVTPELEHLADALRSAGCDARVSACGERSRDGAPYTFPAPGRIESDSVYWQAGCGITKSLAGIAASGTVAIDTGGHGAAPLLSCLPAHHVVLLDESAIFPTLREALESLRSLSGMVHSRMVLVTGPSRTSDIEMTSVVGVHGPLKLDVLIIEGS